MTDNIVVAYGPNAEVVAIEFVNGVRELFAELIESEAPEAGSARAS